MSQQTSLNKKYYFFWKRGFDVLCAILGLILYTPLFIIVALAIKIESQGPILYRHVRLSKNGKPFGFYKFRTMKSDALGTTIGPSLKVESDPRITRVGRFLRKTAIDELPALLNVLKGDMTLVGPRPALPLEIERYDQKERRRLEVKPGLTGYWQVFGREKGSFDFDEMIEMDLEYIEKCSLMLDLRILLRTIAIGLVQKAAY